jgi:hypothetical protein
MGATRDVPLSPAPLTTNDVAQALGGLSRSRVLALEREGRLLASRASNGMRLFDPSSVAAEKARRAGA